MLANDWDFEGDALSVTAIDTIGLVGDLQIIDLANGIVAYNPNGQFEHLAVGETATETFTYTLSDGTSTMVQTVTITITGSNDGPVVVDEPDFNVTEDGTVINGQVEATDVDSDDDATTLTYSLVGSAPDGLTFNADGSYSFDPSHPTYQALAAGEIASASFTWQATDSHGSVSGTDSVIITISGSNDAPTASVITASATEDGGAVTGSFVGLDVDSDDDTTSLTYTIVGAPAEGAVVNNNDGTFTFDPGADFQDLAEGEVRDVTFTYTATDSHGAVSDPTTVAISVTGANDVTNNNPPILISHSDFSTTEDGAVITGQVLANDPDPDDDSSTLTYSLVGSIPSGFTLNSDGTYSFDSSDTAYQSLAAGETTTVTFNWQAADSHGAVSESRTNIGNVGLLDGGYVVVWQDYEPDVSRNYIYGQRYDDAGEPVGDAIVISDEFRGAAEGTITALPDGGFVVSWRSDEIYLQRFDSDASPSSDVLQVNSSEDIYYSDQYPVVTSLADGGFVVVWSTAIRDVGRGISCQRYDANGNAVGNNFEVSTTLIPAHLKPEVTELIDGGFVVAWSSPSTSENIYLQQISSTGAMIGEELQINIDSTRAIWDFSITGLDDGGYVVVWSSWNTDGEYYDVYGQRFAYDGVEVGQQFTINTTTINSQVEPDVTKLADGGFLVTWRSAEIYGQRYAADGTAQGSEFKVNTNTANTQFDPSVTVLADGGFVITWVTVGQYINQNAGIHGQRYDAEGNPVGEEFQVRDLYYAHNTDPDVVGIGEYDSGIDSVNITITGVNDAPVVIDESDLITDEDNTITGQVEATDIDHGASLTYSLVGDPPTGLIFTAEGYYIFNPSAEVYQSLAKGEILTVAFSWQAIDELGAVSATDAVAITVTGANDAPVVEVHPNISTNEDDPVITGQVVATDVDSDDDSSTLVYSLVGEAPAGLSFSTDGSYSFDPSDSTYQSLASGEAMTVSFNWKATDSHGLSSNYLSEMNHISLSNGGYLVTWSSFNPDDGTRHDIYGQRYAADGAAVGQEFQINSTEIGSQNSSVATLLGDDSFVVIWWSNHPDPGSGLFGQRFDTDGNSIGDEFLINTIYGPRGPVVTELSDGGFVVIYSGGRDADDPAGGVFGQRFAVDGSPFGSEFHVNSYTDSYQQYPSVTGLSDGGFIVVWHSTHQDGSGNGVYGQRYAADSSEIGEEFQINDYTLYSQQNPVVTSLDDGGFLVVWQSYGQDGDSSGIFGKRYAADGSEAGDEFQINSTYYYRQYDPAVTTLSDGGYIVTWSSWNQNSTGHPGINGQLFDADGTKIGDEFVINTTSDFDQVQSSVTGLADGGFVVTWTIWVQPGSDYDVYGQQFADDGSKVGEEFLVNTHTYSYQYGSDVIGLPSHEPGVGAVSITITGNDDSPVIQVGDENANTLVGGDAADDLSGLLGDDMLVGGTGDDTLSGGGGADTFVFSNGDTGTDVITDFSQTEGDKLDLADLLSGMAGLTEDSTSLDPILDFSLSDGDTLIAIDVNGDSTPDQNIQLTGVDLVTDTANAGTYSDGQIIDNLLGTAGGPDNLDVV